MAAQWKERMMFTKAESGLILASLLYHDRDCASFVAKAEKELHGFDADYALSLLSNGDAARRERTIKLLTSVKDEGLLNPLLAHLKKEPDPGLRNLLVKGLVTSGRRNTVIAVMNTLGELGDRESKIQALDYICNLPQRVARELLIEAADTEKDPEVIEMIDAFLSKLEQ